MEICFVPDNDYRGFLTQSKLVGVDPGDIVDLQGKVLVAMMAWPFTPLGSVAAWGFLRLNLFTCWSWMLNESW